MLIDNIEECIRVIDQVTEKIAQEKPKEAGKLIPKLSRELQLIIPPMVNSYLRDEMAAVREDMQYWVSQLERIMNAIEGNDLFFLVDVLHFEMKENLQMYCDMVKEAGLGAAL